MRTPSRFLALVASLGLSSCTFNVASQMYELTETSTGSFSTVHLEGLRDPSLDSASITVLGTARTEALARAQLTALRSPGGARERLAEGWELTWNSLDSEGISLQITPPWDSDVWLDALTLEVPSTAALVLQPESRALDVSGLDARVDVQASSGSMRVETSDVVNLRTSSGSTEALALAGTIEGDSGSVNFTFGDWARVQTTSGSIDGELGDGGSVQSNSGSVDVRLVRPLTRDLRVQTTSGSIDLDVPREMPCTLDITSESGSVDIDLGSVRTQGTVRMDVAGGGPLLQVVSTSGSITITSH